MDDGRGGAYLVADLLALRVRPTSSPRRWLASVEIAPLVRLALDLGDGSQMATALLRAVRGREPGPVVVPAREVAGSLATAMAAAVEMARDRHLAGLAALEAVA